MKKLFHAVIFTASLVLFASCQKEKEAISQSLDPVVEVYLSNELGTKAFFDNTATAETFEKKINTLSVLVFDSNDKLLIRRSFDSFEIAGKSCSFSLPKTVANTNCHFYAVANYDVSSVTSKSGLLSLLDETPGDYNGTFAEVTAAAKRSGGFVMTGNTDATIAESGSTTSVSITLKRTVAKIAIRATVSDSFEEYYGGSMTILSTKIESAASKGYLIEPESSSSSISTDYSATQEVSEGKNSLYYVFSNEHITDHGNVKLIINAMYDIDGDETTTADQTEFSYEIPLTGAGSGVIKRNGYYRIAANINGPDGSECSVSVSVSDWESPSTQDVDLGV